MFFRTFKHKSTTEFQLWIQSRIYHLKSEHIPKIHVLYTGVFCIWNTLTYHWDCFFLMFSQYDSFLNIFFINYYYSDLYIFLSNTYLIVWLLFSSSKWGRRDVSGKCYINTISICKMFFNNVELFPIQVNTEFEYRIGFLLIQIALLSILGYSFSLFFFLEYMLNITSSCWASASQT